MSITQQQLKSVLDYDKDTGIFVWKINISQRFKKGTVAGNIDDQGYARISINKKAYKSHRLAWLYEYGKFPDALLDHINRNRSDNRICNLREANFKQNCENTTLYSTNTSGYRGVSFNKKSKKWVAYIGHNGKTRFLGEFNSVIDAAERSKQERKKMFTHSSDGYLSE